MTFRLECTIVIIIVVVVLLVKVKNLNIKCGNCTGFTESKNFPLSYNFSLNCSLIVIIIVVVVGGDIDDRVRGYQQESEES